MTRLAPTAETRRDWLRLARTENVGAVTFEALIPWSALDVEAPPADGINFDLAVVAWYRSRWMSLTGRPPSQAMNEPSRWRPYALDGR